MASRGWEGVTQRDINARAVKPVKARSKYGATKTTIDGLTFDSKKEAARWQVLCALERSGHLRNLSRQLPFALRVRDTVIGSYVPDFLYEERVGDDWVQRVEDVKSPATKKKELYRWKRKHFEAEYGLKILET